MRFEKDLEKKNIDFHSFMANPLESQDLFFDMLDEAEEKIGFVTKDYQIRLEAIQVAGGDFILTVTRSLPENKKLQEKKKIHIRRKRINDFKNTNAVYCFNNFEDFCSFSNFINCSNITYTNIAKNVSLYEYKDKYYLSLSNINLTYPNLKSLFSSITEFATYTSNADVFKQKLLENGKIIMRNNAIKTAIQYFK